MEEIFSLDVHRQDSESAVQYCNRVCSIRKKLEFTWKDVAETINDELGLNYSESWYRKHFQQGTFEILDPPETTAKYEEPTDDINDKLRSLMLKKVEVSDLVVQNNAYIRRLSREETIKDIAHYYADVMSDKKFLDNTCYPVEESDKEGILLLSDWHYGMVCDNAWNKFDPEICMKRIKTLLDKTIRVVKENKIRKVTVMNLSDLIAGRIHTQIRIESRCDVITQTMDVAEILAEFLSALSSYCYVSYYDCLDNHSRIEPNKKDSLDLESLVRIIPWYLEERLSNMERITIHKNEFGADIITCKILGHDVIGVHGDHDSPVTGIDKLTLMTHRHYDLFCTAHRHHFNLDEKNHCIVVGNSSLMGTDSYAEKLRLSSDPSQTFIVVTPQNACEVIYRIVLN